MARPGASRRRRAKAPDAAGLGEWESLLPAAHEEWSDSLKRLQEVLGNIHDLDVLAGRLKRMRGQQLEENLPDWQARIENARQENLHTYRQLTLGTTSIWNTWLSGFPRDEWERYANARVRATRAAMDPRSARTTLVTRLAMRIWSQLR